MFPSNALRTPLILIATLLLCACISQPKTTPEALPAGEWQADPAHTSVTFRIGHANGLSRYTARFDETAASLTFDPAAPRAAILAADISVASLHTGLPDFEGDLAPAADGSLYGLTTDKRIVRIDTATAASTTLADLTGSVDAWGIAATFDGRLWVSSASSPPSPASRRKQSQSTPDRW